MKLFYMLFLSLFLSFAIVACDNKETGNGSDADTYVEGNIADGDKAPEFSLVDINGNKVKLSDYKGKIVLLDFWATWCPPCRKGIPDLISIQNEYKQDVVVIGITLDQKQTLKDVVPFVKEYGINYPILYGNMEIAKAYGNINSIPTSFIVDRNGNITNRHVGLVEKEIYVKEIKQLLKKS
jgi:peroxiredoxin